MNDFDAPLANEVAKLAVRDRLSTAQKTSVLKVLIICLSVLLLIAMFLAADITKHGIDSNYEYLHSLIIETETVSEKYEILADTDGSGNANAFYGNNNQVAGGNISGQSFDNSEQNNDNAESVKQTP